MNELIKVLEEYKKETGSLPGNEYWSKKIEIAINKDSGKPYCSKCGRNIPNKWEWSAAKMKIEIGIDCVAPDALFGRNNKIQFEHDAIDKENSDYQHLLLKIGTNEKYKLCYDCHRKLVKMIGDFLLETSEHDVSAVSDQAESTSKDNGVS